jgi:hypothetical protein
MLGSVIGDFNQYNKLIVFILMYFEKNLDVNFFGDEKGCDYLLSFSQFPMNSQSKYIYVNYLE